MIKDLIEKVKLEIELTEDEVAEYCNEMNLALERDVVKFGKGTIPGEDSEFRVLCCNSMGNIKNFVKIHRIMKEKLLSTMDWFNSGKPFGPALPNRLDACKLVNEYTGKITYIPNEEYHHNQD